MWKNMVKIDRPLIAVLRIIHNSLRHKIVHLKAERIVTCNLQMERETLQDFVVYLQVLYVSALCNTANVKPIIHFCPFLLQMS
jgi:hypothetical protein